MTEASTTSGALKRDIEAYALGMRSSRLMTLAREGRVTKTTVERYLFGILYLIRHTPEHLTLARRYAVARREHELARYFELKAADELGHDRWAEADIASIGIDRVNLPPPKLPGSIVALGDFLRETIQDDPARYLAYVLSAEYFTVLMGPEWVHTLEERCGVPPDSLTVIERHVELDKFHVAEGSSEIDRLIREPARLDRLRETLHASMRHFSAFCDELAAA